MNTPKMEIFIPSFFQSIGYNYMNSVYLKNCYKKSWKLQKRKSPKDGMNVIYKRVWSAKMSAQSINITLW